MADKQLIEQEFLVKTMQPPDPLDHSPTAPGWNMLGELELIAEPNTDHTVSKWLAVILDPLDLHPDLLNKVVKSAQAASARVLQIGMVLKHLHLLVFAPSTRSSNGQTWGFFRIEKVATAKADESSRDHTIEFYLYLEG